MDFSGGWYNTEVSIFPILVLGLLVLIIQYCYKLIQYVLTCRCRHVLILELVPVTLCLRQHFLLSILVGVFSRLNQQLVLHWFCIDFFNKNAGIISFRNLLVVSPTTMVMTNHQLLHYLPCNLGSHQLHSLLSTFKPHPLHDVVRPFSLPKI